MDANTMVRRCLRTRNPARATVRCRQLVSKNLHPQRAVAAAVAGLVFGLTKRVGVGVSASRVYARLRRAMDDDPQGWIQNFENNPMYSRVVPARGSGTGSGSRSIK